MNELFEIYQKQQGCEYILHIDYHLAIVRLEQKLTKQENIIAKLTEALEEYSNCDHPYFQRADEVLQEIKDMKCKI